MKHNLADIARITDIAEKLYLSHERRYNMTDLDLNHIFKEAMYYCKKEKKLIEYLEKGAKENEM